jgi:hypothetical protein
MNAIDLRVARGAALVMGGVTAAWSVLPHVPLCPLYATTGVPCPLCGATRSVVALLRGNPAQSLSYSPIGFVVVAAVVASLIAWKRRVVMIPTWPVVAMLASLWVYNLTLNPTFT